MKYLQVNQDNLITDCIDYAYGDYVEFDGEVPQAVGGGWHKLENGLIVEYLELKPKDETEALKDRVKSTEDALMFLMDMQIGGL